MGKGCRNFSCIKKSGTGSSNVYMYRNFSKLPNCYKFILIVMMKQYRMPLNKSRNPVLIFFRINWTCTVDQYTTRFYQPVIKIIKCNIRCCSDKFSFTALQWKESHIDAESRSSSCKDVNSSKSSNCLFQRRSALLGT
jgi:hypothetical protein